VEVAYNNAERHAASSNESTIQEEMTSSYETVNTVVATETEANEICKLV